MKQITKVFLVLCVCAVSLSCSKDDDEGDGGDGYVCYECTMSYDYGQHQPTTFPICGEKTYAELQVKNFESQSGNGMTIRCVRKK